jgi:hypothetical protein
MSALILWGPCNKSQNESSEQEDSIYLTVSLDVSGLKR